MNENIIGRKDWYYEGVPGFTKSDGKITVILEEEGRRLVKVEFSNHNHVFSHGQRPVFYIQKTYINPKTGIGHWVDEQYDRSKNKMIMRFKLNN